MPNDSVRIPDTDAGDETGADADFDVTGLIDVVTGFIDAQEAIAVLVCGPATPQPVVAGVPDVTRPRDICHF